MNAHSMLVETINSIMYLFIVANCSHYIYRIYNAKHLQSSSMTLFSLFFLCSLLQSVYFLILNLSDLGSVVLTRDIYDYLCGLSILGKTLIVSLFVDNFISQSTQGAHDTVTTNANKIDLNLGIENG